MQSAVRSKHLTFSKFFVLLALLLALAAPGWAAEKVSYREAS